MVCARANAAVPRDVSRHGEGAGQLGAEGGERDQRGGGEDGHRAVVGLVGQLEKGGNINFSFFPPIFLEETIVLGAKGPERRRGGGGQGEARRLPL